MIKVITLFLIICTCPSLFAAVEDSTARPISDTEMVRALAKRFRLTVWPNHVFNDSTIRFRVQCRISEDVEARLSEVGASDAFGWRLDIVKANSEKDLIRSVKLPILADGAEASIDPSLIPEGLYRVQANLVFPNGSAKRIWHEPEPPRTEPYSAEKFLEIHREPVPTITTEVIESPNLLTRPRLLGNPGLHQFPGDGDKDCHGRTVWDLQLHDGRIYVGIGNGFWDLGPVDVWSFPPQLEPVKFKKEFKIDDEAVTVLKDYDGRLLIPGTDATESWDFGNLYIKEDGTWRKKRTVPNGIHVLGILIYRDNLFVTTGTRKGPTLYESADAGETWIRYDAEEKDGRWDRRFYEIGLLEDGLMLTVDQEYFYFFKDGVFTRVITPIFPGLVSDRTSVTRMTSFMGGLLYAADEWRETASPEPLYYINSLEQGVSVVEAFENLSVRDILVRDGTCHILTSTREDIGYVSEIYMAQDLKTWERVARFHSKAMAKSLERAEDRYFVGMATLRGNSVQESGNIYVLE